MNEVSESKEFEQSHRETLVRKGLYENDREIKKKRGKFTDFVVCFPSPNQSIHFGCGYKIGLIYLVHFARFRVVSGAMQKAADVWFVG